MSAEAGYGTQPDVLAALLAVVGDAGSVLSYDEDRSFAALSLGRFGSVGSSQLDWSGVEVLHRSPAFDGDGLRGLLRGLSRPDELAVVFWSNLAVPSLALEVGLVARHAEAILECCFACWVYLADSGSLIEFQDGEGFTAGRVPE